MKKNIISVLFVLLLTVFQSVLAQAPQKMSYQSVVRNASGQLVASSAVGMKVSVLQGSISGTAVFAETHQVSTNTNGLVSIEIGGGTAVSGTFANINWGNGPYFIKTEIDPNGGSNYTITGTSQLLSVPYALYAERTKSYGKSTVFLTGDISDAQAQAKLAIELGPFTESIYVSNTTNLVSLDLSVLTSDMIQIKVENNAALTSLIAPNVKQIHGDLNVASNPALTSINFGALTTVFGYVNIKQNAALNSLNLNNVDWIAGDFNVVSCEGVQSLQFSRLVYCKSLTVSGNNQATNIAFPQLKNTTNSISISSNNSAISITMPLFEKITGTYENRFFWVRDNASLVSLDLPIVHDLSQLAIQDNPNLSNLSVNVYDGKYFKLINSNVSTLTLPAYVQGLIEITGNSALTMVSLPNMTKAIDGFKISDNSSLSSISFPLLTQLQNTNAIDFRNNQLPSTEVNYVLHRALSINMTNMGSKIVRLNQLPPAPPSGQGIIDKAALISSGNLVYTD